MSTIAVGSFIIECNHFGGELADLDTFRRYDYVTDDDVLKVNDGAVGGMLRTLEEAGHSAHPLLVASACPSSLVTDTAYDEIKSQLLDRLPSGVDGVLLALHGSSASQSIGDLEGDLIEAVRRQVGSAPIVGTLDLHAHVTQQMIDHCDALLAWETYPHRDAFTTGERGAATIVDILSGSLKPTMVSAKVPVLVSGILGHTEGEGPFADVMRAAKRIEQDDATVYSTSAFLVHPYLDVAEMGGGAVVITNDDESYAQKVAVDLATDYGNRRFDLEPELVTPEAAIAASRSLATGTIVLAETADCCGGGAAGDSVHGLRALLEYAPDASAYVPVVDPEAANVCHRADAGQTVTLSIGHRLDEKWGIPIETEAVVHELTDGRFTYSGGIWDGREAEMGPSALVEIGSTLVGISSHPTYEWAGEQLQHFYVDYRQVRFVVAKNPMNYRIAFPEALEAFVLDTAGPTPPTCRHLPYKHVERPYYPADEAQPVVRVYRKRRD